MLNLGGLFFTLDADTRGLMNAQRRVEQFSQTVRNAFNGVQRGAVAPQFANQLLRQERGVVQMLERIKALQNNIRQSSIKPTDATRLLDGVTRAYDNFTRKMASGVPLNNLDFTRRMTHMQSVIADTSREFRNLHNVAARSFNTKGFHNFKGVLQGLGTSSLVVQGHLGGMSTRFLALSHLVNEFGLTAALASASIAGLTAGIGLMAVAAVTAGRELQKLQAGFTALTGNAAVAAIHIDYVRDVANQAGLAFNDVGKGYMRFLASAQAGGLTLDQTQTAFRGVSLAAATMQLSVEDTQGVFRALDQMMSKGTVQAEELRGQLGDRLPGAFIIAAEAMGVSTAELNKMLKAGEVVSAEFVPKFVDALQKMWNIDPSAPIETLQASITRLSNSWTYFGQELDRATGATRVFQAFVTSLGNALNSISANLPQIIGFIGALTGAFIGLAAAMAINALFTYVAAWGSITTAFQYAIIVVRQMIASMVGLNAVMMANPALALARVITILVATIAGATYGYKLLTDAVAANHDALSNTAHIESYIDAQRRMGVQISSVTQAMMDQLMVQNAIASAAVVKASREANRPTAGIQDYLTYAAGAVSVASGMTNASSLEAISMTPQQRAAQRANQELEAALTEARETARLYDDLNSLMSLPEMAANPPMLGDTDTASAAKEAADNIDDFVRRMQLADAAIRAMSGGGDYRFIEDMFAAREILDGLNNVQLGKLDEQLRAAGFTVGALDQRLAEVLERTRQATQAARIYADIWDELGDVARNVESLGRQLDYVMEGGDPANLRSMFEAFDRAGEMLRGLDPNTQAGRDALLGLQTRMADLGVESTSTGDILADTTAQLAAFLNQEDQAAALLATMANLSDEFRDIRQSTADMQSLTAIFGQRGRGMFGAANAGEEAQKAQDRANAVRDLTRVMKVQGASQKDINRVTSEYMAIMTQYDEVERRLGVAQQRAESFRDSLRDAARTGIEGFKGVLEGVKSVGDALRDLASNILDSAWQNFIINPVNEAINNIGRPQAANDNGATEVGALANAASHAANVMNGGLIGAIASMASQVFTSTVAESSKAAAVSASTAAEAAHMAAIVGTTAALMTLAGAAIAAATGLSVGGDAGGGKGGILKSLAGAAKSYFQQAPGKAFGGPMAAGSLYQINEHGLSGEYFIPAVNGYMSPTASNNNGGSPINIDARTTIDARGASADAVAEIKRELAARDRRLRSELPSIIDGRVNDSSQRGRFG